MSPTLENMENCLKTWHRSRQNLSKRSKYAEPPTFQGWTKGDMQQHKVDNNKKAGTPQQLKTNYCGPLDTENT